MTTRANTLLIGAATAWALAWHGAAVTQNAAASGEALTCLARTNIDRWLIIDANRILVATRDQKLYRNDLPRACPALRADSQISQSTSDSQLCAGATFQILIRVSSSGNTTSVTDKATGVSTSVEGPGLIGGPVCALGAFTPIGAEEATALIAVSKQPPPSRRERRSAREAQENAAAPNTNAR